MPSDVPWPPPHYEWWNAVEVENSDGKRGGGKKTFEYKGFEETLAYIASVLESRGPFDGFLAFSQGTILASLLLAAWSKADEAREKREKGEQEQEEERRRRRASSSSSSSSAGKEDASTSSSSSGSPSASASPLVLPPRLADLKPGDRPRFAVIISGVWAKAPICSALEREEEKEGGSGGGARWTRRESGSGSGGSDDGAGGEQQQQQPGAASNNNNNTGCIRAPSLHVIGRRDYVAPLSRRLAAAFRHAVVVEHAGGHVVPRLPPAELATLRAFLGSQQQALASSL